MFHTLAAWSFWRPPYHVSQKKNNFNLITYVMIYGDYIHNSRAGTKFGANICCSKYQKIIIFITFDCLLE